MIEFDNFCFLQNQKTGCSMVEAFLRQCCSEGIVRYEKHRAAKTRKAGKFYFISVREPFDAYQSLFNYGLDGKGELYEILVAKGLGRFYEQGIAGFSDWLEFVLSPTNAELIYPRGCHAVAAHVGLVSFRFLRLAALDFESQSQYITDREAIQGYFNANTMVDKVMRYESLQTDLLEVVNGQLQKAFVDLPAARAWIEASPRVNASTKRESPVLSEAVRKKLIDREWFLYQNYYAEMGAKALQ